MGSLAGAAAVLALASNVLGKQSALAPDMKAPPTLADTGLYADFASLRVDPAHLGFAPQYPLWTDGAAPAIDASDPERWVFLSARGSGRNSPSTAGRSRPAILSISRTASGFTRLTPGAWTRARLS